MTALATRPSDAVAPPPLAEPVSEIETPRATPVSPSRIHLAAVALIGLIGLFYLATFREGHDWGDDFAMYLMHARNVADARPYFETGYIYNPSYSALGPQVYPPVFPLMLAPVYKSLGLNFTAFKIATTLFFFLSLYVVYRLLRDDLAPRPLMALLAVLGLNPYFWAFKDQILSDTPFLFFVLVALFCARQAERSTVRSSTIVYLAGFSVATLLATGDRLIGIVLVPAFFLSILIQGNLRKMLVPLVVMSVGLALSMVKLIPFALSYADNFGFGLIIARGHATEYTRFFYHFFSNGSYFKPGARWLFVIVSVLALIGFIRIVMQRRSILEIFFVLYGATLLLIQSSQDRYMIPLVPLYAFYALVGLKTLLNRLGSRKTRIAASVLSAWLIASYFGAYSRSHFGPLDEGIGTPASAELFQWVREASAPSDIFMFRKPRALALMTDRSASVYPIDRSDAALWEYIDRAHVRYVVSSRFFSEDKEFLQPFIARNPGRLEPAFTNSDFRVYRIAESGIVAR